MNLTDTFLEADMPKPTLFAVGKKPARKSWWRVISECMEAIVDRGGESPVQQSGGESNSAPSLRVVR